MKKFVFLLLLTRTTILLPAQAVYDSISISRCTIENEYYSSNEWAGKLKSGEFKNYIYHEKTIWAKTTGSKEQVKPEVLLLTEAIKKNGTQDVTRCFIPRHSINFYEKGMITRYLLVCFECDGVHFSDDPKVFFIKSIDTRDQQMLELKKLFKDLL